MENKNLLLAIGLSVAFLFFWATFVVPRYAPPKPAPSVSETSPAAATSVTASAIVNAPAGTSPQEAQETVLRDPENEIALSSHGGGIRHWRLLLKNHETDLVANPDVEPLPLATFPDTNFKMQVQGRTATMQANLDKGIRMIKILRLSEVGYLNDLTFQFENPTSQAVELKDWEWGWGPGLGTAENERKENSRLIRALSMGKLKAHVLKPGTYDEFGQWAAIDNRYFLVAFLPVSAGQPQLSVTGTKDQTQVRLHQTISIPAHGQTILQYQLYVGPKGYTQLGHYRKNLQEAVDFGVFSPLGKLILRAIYWLQRHTGNYGWAIVILTVILQILMFPLTIKSFKATLAMKKLQPQIAALQKAYKSDPKRLNLEMMNLYKKSGTNPFGGCLPMLLQLPIFWALFTTLRNAYELRGAPWIGWVHDLSVADPLHILPIIMGGAMFLQQRMSGAVTDPTQKQMMLMMPIMFTVMFFNFPAGLVLYWLTNNLITMLFQYGMLRYNQPNPPLALVTK
jgi:YidC/Oxa1 family membrane protein insertase